MKEDKNMFFYGRRMPPSPTSSVLRSFFIQLYEVEGPLTGHSQLFAIGPFNYKQPRQACGVTGLIKNIFLSFFAYCFLFISICHADAVSPQVCHMDNCVTVEVVSKQDDMERGLMYRTSLDQNKGMLFVFTVDDKQQFWMKNMHFSLDILWISIDGHIVFIGQNIPACTNDPCPVYTPDKSARYVLELNSGYAVSHHWMVGDKVNFKGI